MSRFLEAVRCTLLLNGPTYDFAEARLAMWMYRANGGQRRMKAENCLCCQGWHVRFR